MHLDNVGVASVPMLTNIDPPVLFELFFLEQSLHLLIQETIYGLCYFSKRGRLDILTNPSG